MDATVVLAWLTDVCPSSPSPSVELPLSPPPLPRARYQRRRPHTQLQQPLRNHLPTTVKTFKPITYQDRAVRMPPRRRSPRKRVIAVEEEEQDPADEPLRLGRMSAALDKRGDPPNTHLDHPNDGKGRERLYQPADKSHDDNVSTTIAPSAAVSTNTTLPSRSLFSHKLSQATFSEPSNTDDPASLRSAVTGSSRARSQSPIKQANDLMKLDVPVYWRDISLVELQRKLDDRNSAGLLKSINSVLRKGYLPVELRDILDPELGLDESDDILYAKMPSPLISESQLQRASLLTGTSQEALSSFVHLQSLLSELEILSTIVATTQDYSTVPRAEASWNEQVHSRMLDLAVSCTPSVGVENVTRANIAKDFLPPMSARYVSLPTGSKLIDYALVVKPSPTFGDKESQENNSSKKLSLERIVHFVDMLDYPSFNQSSYSPLCTMPSGIFIETKVNTQKSTEAKAQLGMWLASWYGRVSEFPNIRDHDILPLPVLPILLIEAGVWELHFAFDAGSHYDVCGRVSIGSTHSLEEAYRLLAVLRILAKWVETDFLIWVEGCLQRAGV